MPTLSIYLPDDLYFLIKERARAKGKKISVFIREIIEKALKGGD